MRNRLVGVAAFLFLLILSSAPALAQVEQWTYTVAIPEGKTFNTAQNIASDAKGNSVWTFRFFGNGPVVTRVVWLDRSGNELVAQDFFGPTSSHSVSVFPLKFDSKNLILEKVESVGTLDGEVAVGRKIVRYKRLETRVTTEEVPFALVNVPVHPDFKTVSATGFLSFGKNGTILEVKRFLF